MLLFFFFLAFLWQLGGKLRFVFGAFTEYQWIFFLKYLHEQWRYTQGGIFNKLTILILFKLILKLNNMHLLILKFRKIKEKYNRKFKKLDNRREKSNQKQKSLRKCDQNFLQCYPHKAKFADKISYHQHSSTPILETHQTFLGIIWTSLCGFAKVCIWQMFCEGFGQFNLYSKGHIKESSNMKEPVWFECIVFFFSFHIKYPINFFPSVYFSFYCLTFIFLSTFIPYQKVHSIEEWMRQNHATLWSRIYVLPTFIFDL